MSPRRSKKLIATRQATERTEQLRERMRTACLALIERWLPIAASDELTVRKEGRTGPVIDDAPLEAGLKAGAFLLKTMERLSRLDGLDAPEKQDISAPEPVDPVELARRVRTVAPLLMARLRLGDTSRITPPAKAAEGGDKK